MKFTKILGIIMALALIMCVVLAVAALCLNEVLIVYQCSIITAHLLIITYVWLEVINDNIKGDKE